MTASRRAVQATALTPARGSVFQVRSNRPDFIERAKPFARLQERCDAHSRAFYAPRPRWPDSDAIQGPISPLPSTGSEPACS